MPTPPPIDVNPGQPATRMRRRAPAILAMGGLLLVSALLWLTWITSGPIIDELARVERSRLPRLELLHAAKSADLDASVALRNVLLVKEPRLDESELRRYAQANGAASAAITSFAASSRRAEEAALLQATLQARKALVAARAAAIEEDQRGPALDSDASTVRLQNALDEYLAPMQRLQDFQGAQVTSLVDELAVRASRVRALLIAAGLAAGATIVLAAAAWRAELRREVSDRERRIVSLREQRDALVREVHHRIKNHLQGLLGLFETQRFAIGDEASQHALATLHGHVLALVGIHGMQARDAGECISLKDLVRQQVELVRAGFPGTQLAVTEDAQLEDTSLPGEASLPVALVVTELIVNAIKHGAAAPIRISLRMPGETAQVTVANRLTGPSSLDWKSGRGLGTGLSLVATLLQETAELAQTTTSEEMTMTLNLRIAGAAAAS